MKKSGRKGFIAILLVCIMMICTVVPVKAAQPSLSSSKYMMTYVLSTNNNTYVYTSYTLKTRGTSSPYKAYNACIYASCVWLIHI